MFLPKFDGQDDRVIEFEEIELLDASEAENAERVAILSQRGVNLLVQRWANHLTRVVVPTDLINEMISGPFDEADLFGDAVSDLVEAGMPAATARETVEAWLSEGPRGETRRDRLSDAQVRSEVRMELRAQVKEWARSI